MLPAAWKEGALGSLQDTQACPLGQGGGFVCFTFTELGTVIHTLVVVLVLCAEGSVVVVAQGVPARVPAVIPHKQPVAVEFIAQRELPVLGVAGVPFPVLHRNQSS